MSVAKEKGTANRRQTDQEKRKRKRPRAAAIFEDIATTIETSLSSMENRFAAMMKRQMEREERLLHKGLKQIKHKAQNNKNSFMRL